MPERLNHLANLII